MKKLYLALVSAVLCIAALTAVMVSADAELPFTDVPADGWYYDTVVEVYALGLMKGQSATLFAPTKTMSRAEFVTLFYRITGVTETGFGSELSKFDDGETDAWYSEAMGWAVNRGLIKGMDDNTVRPAQTITRAEIAVMTVRYLDYMGYTLLETAEESVFSDDSAIADWCREQVYACQTYGIFKGDDAGRFNPSNNASRAEGATIVLRLTKSIDEYIETEGTLVVKKGEESPFTVLFAFGSGGNGADMEIFQKRIKAEFDCKLSTKPYAKSSVKSENLRIIFNVPSDPVIEEMTAGLGENGYAFKFERSGEYATLYFAYNSSFGKSYGIEKFIATCLKDGNLIIPEDLTLSGNKAPQEFFKTINAINRNTRDPYIFYEDGVYYAYITGWRIYKTTSLDGEWTEVKNGVVKPADYKTNNWAPEMHKYNGEYYLFTTYTPKYCTDETHLTGGHAPDCIISNGFENHGCIIMKASSPEGPFEMITDGWITPPEWDCIDGTLYIDPDGQPWMVFVHEHTSLDRNGAFAAAKLSEDFTHFISEPIELFRAKDPLWAYAGITDGCFMYTTAEGELLMLWSNNDVDGYCLAVSRSASGKLDGEWTHDEPMLFAENIAGADGGHGMIFTDVDGQMYAVLHSPNDYGGNSSRMTIVPIIERNGVLIWDIES